MTSQSCFWLVPQFLSYSFSYFNGNFYFCTCKCFYIIFKCLSDCISTSGYPLHSLKSKLDCFVFFNVFLCVCVFLTTFLHLFMSFWPFFSLCFYVLPHSGLCFPVWLHFFLVVSVGRCLSTRPRN